MQWYYVSERSERIAVPENRMQSLVATGAIQPTTLVWRKGMTSWVSCGEVKPGLFLAPSPVKPNAGVSAQGTAADSQCAADSGSAAGLLHELTVTLRRYSGWMQVSAGMHFASGVVAAALATTLGVFAVLKPARIESWQARLPDDFRFLLQEPVITIAILIIVGAVSLLLGEHLISGALRLRRAQSKGSPEELQFALRSMGRFFQLTVLTAVAGLLLAGILILFQYRKGQAGETPRETAKPAPVRL